MTPPGPPTLNPAAHTQIGDWMRLQPPPPLPRTVAPMPYEAIHHYLRRLADASHQTVSQISKIIHLHNLPAGLDFNDIARERLAAAASQPIARIRRLYWGPAPGATRPSGQPEEYGDGLRPACRRCAACHGLPGPVPCKFPDHDMICRHHQLWTGPGVLEPAGQHDLAQLPELLRAQRHHDRLLRQHQPEMVHSAYQRADQAWRQHLGPHLRWTPSQFHRFTTLTSANSQAQPQPGQGLAGAGHLRAVAATIAIYPDVVQLTALILDPRHPRQCWPSSGTGSSP